MRGSVVVRRSPVEDAAVGSRQSAVEAAVSKGGGEAFGAVTARIDRLAAGNWRSQASSPFFRRPPRCAHPALADEFCAAEIEGDHEMLSRLAHYVRARQPFAISPADWRRCG